MPGWTMAEEEAGEGVLLLLFPLETSEEGRSSASSSLLAKWGRKRGGEGRPEKRIKQQFKKKKRQK